MPSLQIEFTMFVKNNINHW